jgi:hypothetical protein
MMVTRSTDNARRAALTEIQGGGIGRTPEGGRDRTAGLGILYVQSDIDGDWWGRDPPFVSALPRAETAARAAHEIARPAK